MSRLAFLSALAALLAWAGACAPAERLYDRATGTYHLRAPDDAGLFAEGLAFNSTSELEMVDASVRYIGEGWSLEGDATTHTYDVREVVGLTPTSGRIRFLRNTTDSSVTLAGELHSESEREPLDAATVSVTVGDDGGIQAALETGVADEEVQRALDELVEELRTREDGYLRERVRVGDTWQVPSEVIAVMFGSGKTLSVSGEMSYTFEDVVEHQGIPCARLLMRLNEVTLVTRDPELGAETTMVLGGSGTVLRSLEDRWDTRAEFTGPFRMSAPQARLEGLPAGVKVDLEMRGQLRLTTTLAKL